MRARNYLLVLKNDLLKKQGGRCALCQRTRKDLKRRQHQKISNAFVLDHCHKFGRYRGALCASCNQAIRGFDMPNDWLKRAIEYTGIPMQIKEPS